MPNRVAHEIAGAVTASVVAVSLNDDIDQLLLEMAASVSVGIIAGRLPDLIEPSLGNPNHRQFFRSLVFAGGVVMTVRHLYLWRPQTPQGKVLRWSLILIAAAYLSHLALGSRTPMSLPLMGKF